MIIKTLFVSVLLMLSSGVYAEKIAPEKKEVKQEPIEMTVYRSPTCGCCSKWITHMEKNKFKVKDIVTNDMPVIKNKYGVPQTIQSCHTAIVEGYVVEGHVPASDVMRLLKTKPKVIGISVPNMVAGTPGMEMGARKDAYKVISFDKKSEHKIFKSYEAEK